MWVHSYLLRALVTIFAFLSLSLTALGTPVLAPAPLIWDSFVAIKAHKESLVSTGSGAILSEQRCQSPKWSGQSCLVILTSSHVIHGQEHFFVQGHKEGEKKLSGQWHRAHRLARLAHHDLATLEVPVQTFKDLSWQALPKESRAHLPLGYCDPKYEKILHWHQRTNGHRVQRDPKGAALELMSTPGLKALIVDMANDDERRTVGLGYAPGELQPWLITPTLNKAINPPVRGNEKLFRPSLQTLPYLKNVAWTDSFFVHPGMSGSVLWGCDSQRRTRAPLGLVLRGHLTLQHSWLMPWSEVQSQRARLLTRGDDNLKHPWQIQAKNLKRSYFHAESGLRLSDWHFDPRDVSGREGIDTGREGIDTGREGIDSGATPVLSDFLLKPEWVQASQAMSTYHQKAEDGFWKDLHFQRPEVSFLPVPAQESYGAVIEKDGQKVAVYHYQEDIVYGAADLLAKTSKDPQKLNHLFKQGQVQKPRTFFNNFASTLPLNWRFNASDGVFSIEQWRRGRATRPGHDYTGATFAALQSSSSGQKLLTIFLGRFHIQLTLKNGKVSTTTFKNYLLPDRGPIQFQVKSSSATQLLLVSQDGDPFTWFQIVDREDHWSFEFSQSERIAPVPLAQRNFNIQVPKRGP